LVQFVVSRGPGGNWTIGGEGAGKEKPGGGSRRAFSDEEEKTGLYKAASAKKKDLLGRANLWLVRKGGKRLKTTTIIKITGKESQTPVEPRLVSILCKAEGKKEQGASTNEGLTRREMRNRRRKIDKRSRKKKGNTIHHKDIREFLLRSVIRRDKRERKKGRGMGRMGSGRQETTKPKKLMPLLPTVSKGGGPSL